jgi:glycine/D-amino acid oxidase-like deaminating enzyme/nitrite reductase/ring-hydroxylating ferredoxin subunit
MPAMQAMLHTSFWHETANDTSRRYRALERDIEADVAIIGGGITGLTAARHLKENGRRVVVLESGIIGGGTTGYTTAHLDMTTDDPLPQMVSDFGEEKAAAVISASRLAIDQIEAWCREFGDCEFARVPSYEYTERDDGLEPLHEQFRVAQRLGIPASFTQTVPLPFPCLSAMRVEGQGRMHAMRYLNRLAASVAGDGCEIFENTMAKPPDDGEPCTVETHGGKVRAKEVFVATHSPFLGISQLDTRVYAYQSYVIAVRVEEEIADALFWDNDKPYHYIRRASPADPDLILIGGADHKTGQGGDERQSFDQLEQYAHERFSVRTVEHRWSAEYFVPADGLPHIGKVPATRHLWISTGYDGTGITLGTVGGRLVADLILGRDNRLADIVRPGRLTLLASADEFVTENLDVARRFIGDRFGSERIDSLEQIGAGTGHIVTIGGKQVAAYRDPSGKLFTLSPVCTHAGCIVQWNDAERTWDCPCHGGRYAATGQRVYGPPPRDLAPEHVVDEERHQRAIPDSEGWPGSP